METLVGELPTGTTNPAPVITCWLPEGERTGSSIVILPGGGYGALARTSWVSIRIASALWDRRPVAI